MELRSGLRRAKAKLLSIGLSGAESRALAARFFDHLTHQQHAKQERISVNASRMRVKRANQRLRAAGIPPLRFSRTPFRVQDCSLSSIENN